MKRRPVSPHPFLPRSEQHNPPWAVAPSQRLETHHLADIDLEQSGPDPSFPSHVLFRGDCETAIEHLAQEHPAALALLPCDLLARLLVHGQDCGALPEEAANACLEAARSRLRALAGQGGADPGGIGSVIAARLEDLRILEGAGHAARAVAEFEALLAHPALAHSTLDHPTIDRREG